MKTISIIQEALRQGVASAIKRNISQVSKDQFNKVRGKE